MFFVYGSGAHGRVVKDILNVSFESSHIYFVDDDPYMHGSLINGSRVISFENIFEKSIRPKVHIAFGNPFTREKIHKKLASHEYENFTVIHPNAYISSSAKIGEGCLVGSHSIVNSNSVIHENVLINNSVIIEHDTVVRPYSSISPGSTIGGRCFLGEYSFIGSGAIIEARVNVSVKTIVGMGSVLKSDTETETMYYGVPAKRIRKITNADWQKLF